MSFPNKVTSLALVGFGFFLGLMWTCFFRPRPETQVPVVSPVVALPSSTPLTKPSIPVESLSSTNSAVKDEFSGLRTYSWIRKQGTHISGFDPFPFAKFDFSLAIMLGLSSDEVDRLNQAIKFSKQQISEIQIRTATSSMDADGKTLSIKIPPLQADSASIYAELLAKFKQTLGPERYQMFNEMSGDSFDRSFDRFGLNPLTYEVNLKGEVRPDGSTVYPYKISGNDVGSPGSSYSQSGSSTMKDLQETYPIFLRFLPK